MTSGFSDDVHRFLEGGRVPSAVFAKPGDAVTGTVLTAEMRQQRDFATGALLEWDDGSPRMQCVITLQTEQRDSHIDNDNGQRRVYARGALANALQSALLKSGARLDRGGTMTVTFTHTAEPTDPKMNGAKQYTVAYEGPPAGFGADDLPADDDEVPF